MLGEVESGAPGAKAASLNANSILKAGDGKASPEQAKEAERLQNAELEKLRADVLKAKQEREALRLANDKLREEQAKASSTRSSLANEIAMLGEVAQVSCFTHSFISSWYHGLSVPPHLACVETINENKLSGVVLLHAYQSHAAADERERDAGGKSGRSMFCCPTQQCLRSYSSVVDHAFYWCSVYACACLLAFCSLMVTPCLAPC